MGNYRKKTREDWGGGRRGSAKRSQEPEKAAADDPKVPKWDGIGNGIGKMRRERFPPGGSVWANRAIPDKLPRQTSSPGRSRQSGDRDLT